jgi:hypothetical protein
MAKRKDTVPSRIREMMGEELPRPPHVCHWMMDFLTQHGATIEKEIYSCCSEGSYQKHAFVFAFHGDATLLQVTVSEIDG